MAAFKFRLQKVLDYRQSTVERLRLELAAHNLQRDQENKRLEEMRRAERDVLAEQQALHAQACRVDDLLQLADQTDRIRIRIVDQMSVVERLAAEAELLQHRVDVASKNSKVLEKLREHHADDFHIDELHFEQNETAETAALVRQRQQR